jgi:predicted esterase
MSTVARLVLTLAILSVMLVLPKGAHAKDASAAAKSAKQEAWCAPEIESLPGDVCYLDGTKGTAKSSRRTLVIFLHGAIAKNTTWSWNHERMILRVAKYHGVEVLFPKSPLTDGGYVWPGKLDEQKQTEQALIDNWMAAKAALEKRDGRSFDEVFVMGFSSGAYFTSSLAMRGRVDADGYAVFAGGQSQAPVANPVERFSAVFVGVCAQDSTGTAVHSRAFAGSLASASIPRMVSEQPVGHGLSEVHFAQALTYLRSMNKPRVAAVDLLDQRYWRFAIAA